MDLVAEETYRSVRQGICSRKADQEKVGFFVFEPVNHRGDEKK